MARRRLDLRGAAEVLGTSVDAVRKRIARGTLESEKVDGKVYVWLDDGAPRSDTDALISEMHGTGGSRISGSNSRPNDRHTRRPVGCSLLPWSGSRRS